MTFEEAKKLLNDCERQECRDHAFGDREVFWVFDIDGVKIDIADGYFGGGSRSVWILDPTVEMDRCEFTGEQARELAKCGKVTIIDRNDETGPDEYRGW